MPPKATPTAVTGKTFQVDSFLSVKSRLKSNATDATVEAHMIVPPDGGWGWIVVIASFYSNFFVDGICFSFGNFLEPISQGLNLTLAQVALIGSISSAFYFLSGPIVSALANRYGFRATAMAGALMASAAFSLCYFAETLVYFITFYGMLGGMGLGFLFLPSVIVVGFYFERWRSAATAIAVCGSGFGTVVMAPFNAYLITNYGWRATFVVQGVCLGSIFFVAMVYYPLEPIIVNVSEDKGKPILRTPSFYSMASNRSYYQADDDKAGFSERLFGAPANVAFPTAAEVIVEEPAGPSSLPNRQLSYTFSSIDAGGLSFSNISSLNASFRSTVPSTSRRHHDDLETIQEEGRCGACFAIKRCWSRYLTRPLSKCWRRLCPCWKPHVREARPLYRDDIFYDGSLLRLPEYRNQNNDNIDVEYHMTVTRAVTTADLKERGKLCSLAVRRVLATMLDVSLLSRPSFVCVAMSGMLTCLGLMVPYVFVTERAISNGMSKENAKWLISVIGMANTLGRIFCGILSTMRCADATFLSTVFILAGGFSVCFSYLSYAVGFQYAFCAVFGITMSCIASLRSIMMVDLYGLEKLSNAFGILLLFQGGGTLAGTPLAGTLIKNYNYQVGFIIAGSFLVAGGLLLAPTKRLSKWEDKKMRQRVDGRGL